MPRQDRRLMGCMVQSHQQKSVSPASVSSDEDINCLCLLSEKEGKYFHYLVPAEEASVEEQPMWQGRMKEGERIQKQITEELLVKMTERMENLEQRMTDLNETLQDSNTEKDASN